MQELAAVTTTTKTTADRHIFIECHIECQLLNYAKHTEQLWMSQKDLPSDHHHFSIVVNRSIWKLFEFFEINAQSIIFQ